MGRYAKMDFFVVVVQDGNKIASGIDGNGNPYRIYGFQGKEFKLTAVEVKSARIKKVVEKKGNLYYARVYKNDMLIDSIAEGSRAKAEAQLRNFKVY